MSNSHNRYGDNVVFDGVEDPVVTGAETVEGIGSLKLLDTVRTGVIGERINAFGQALAVSLRYGGKVALRAAREEYLVRHVPSLRRRRSLRG
jgi:hypothetical protein